MVPETHAAVPFTMVTINTGRIYFYLIITIARMGT